MQGFSADAFSTNAFSVQAFSFGAAIQPPALFHCGGRSRSRSIAQPQHQHTGRTRKSRDDDLLFMHRL